MLVINLFRELLDLVNPGGIFDEFRKKRYVFRSEADG